MATRVDHTLSSNLLTAALVPRVDIAIGHGLKYLAQTLFQRSAPRNQPYPPRGLSPASLQPGNAASGAGRASTLPALRCAETGRPHEQLGRDMIDDIGQYHEIAQVAFDPAKKAGAFSMKSGVRASNDAAADKPVDAWQARVQIPGKDGVPIDQNILPDSLMHSSLLNRRLGSRVAEGLPPGQTLAQLEGQQKALTEEHKNLSAERAELWKQMDPSAESTSVDNNRLNQVNQRIAAIGRDLAGLASALETQRIASGSAIGAVQNQFPNTLYDPLTGFCATISVRKGNEVVIGFSGMGSQRGWLAQGVRGALNALGLAPPKNMAQASKLTQMVKAHLDQLNRQLPSEKKLKLTLSGFSMGGGLATYAALRNNVQAVVISPMRLGLLARAKCGQAAIKNAPKLVTEVTVEGDWVADNSRTRALKVLSLPSYLLTGRKADALGAIGYRYLIPKPSETERMTQAAVWEWSEKEIENIGRKIDVHRDFKLCLEVHRNRLDQAERSQAPGNTDNDTAPQRTSSAYFGTP